MKTLYIERSTGECRDGKWVEALDLEGVERIVVGTGPGSFAGIRSALAFAQGYALATSCEVLGLPSACACAAQAIEQSNNPNNRTIRLAVVGDARQGKIWVALFAGFRLEKDVFQVNQSELKGTVPMDYVVTTPDEKRIGALARFVKMLELEKQLPAKSSLLKALEDAKPAAKPKAANLRDI